MSEQDYVELRSRLRVDRGTKVTRVDVGGAFQGPSTNQKLSSQAW